MSKTISDEIIISALMNHGTIKAAAAAINVTERTIYDRMTNGEFKVLYKSAKADVVRNAVYTINNHLGEAVETVVSIMTDQAVNAAVRLQAAQVILNNAGKFSERLTESETAVDRQKDSNEFDLNFTL